MFGVSVPIRRHVRDGAAVLSSAEKRRLETILRKVGYPIENWKGPVTPLRAVVSTHHDMGKCYELYHLRAHGDAILQHEVHRRVRDYCLGRDGAVAMSVARCCSSAYYNLYALRAAAEDLGMASCMDADCRDDTESSSFNPIILEDEVRQPVLDVRGTSFDYCPHPFAQSTLPMRLSHLVACVDAEFGRAAAQDVVARVLRLDGAVNVPLAALDTLRMLIHRYSPGTVGLALLAAMEVPVTWMCEVRPYKSNDSESTSGQQDNSNPEPAQDGDVAPSRSPAEVSRDLATATVTEKMYALSPSQYDELLRDPSNCAYHYPVQEIPSGWLQRPEVAPHERNLEPHAPTYFSDSLYIPSPQDGGHYRNSKLRFTAANQDPDQFYKHDKDIGRGIEINTHGLPVPAFVASLQKPSRMTFFVAMKSALSHNVISAASADSYTRARLEVMQKFLVAVAHDLHSMSGSGRHP